MVPKIGSRDGSVGQLRRNVAGAKGGRWQHHCRQNSPVAVHAVRVPGGGGGGAVYYYYYYYYHYYCISRLWCACSVAVCTCNPRYCAHPARRRDEQTSSLLAPFHRPPATNHHCLSLTPSPPNPPLYVPGTRIIDKQRRRAAVGAAATVSGRRARR